MGKGNKPPKNDKKMKKPKKVGKKVKKASSGGLFGGDSAVGSY